MCTQIKFILKGCDHCHGDLILDEDARGSTAALIYECLQCGRTKRFLEAPVVSRPAAA